MNLYRVIGDGDYCDETGLWGYRAVSLNETAGFAREIAPVFDPLRQEFGRGEEGIVSHCHACVSSMKRLVFDLNYY